MSKEIEIQIAPGGAITVEGHGFKGPECEQATRAIEDALGERQSSKRKPEYHLQAAVRQQRVGEGGAR